MISVIKHALLVTGFVTVMMLVIEYLNVLSQGDWQKRLINRRWGQYLESFQRKRVECRQRRTILKLDAVESIFAELFWSARPSLYPGSVITEKDLEE